MDKWDFIVIAALGGIAYWIYKKKTELSPTNAEALFERDKNVSAYVVTPQKAETAKKVLPGSVVAQSAVVAENTATGTTYFFSQADLNNLSGFQRTLLALGVPLSRVV